MSRTTDPEPPSPRAPPDLGTSTCWATSADARIAASGPHSQRRRIRRVNVGDGDRALSTIPRHRTSAPSFATKWNLPPSSPAFLWDHHVPAPVRGRPRRLSHVLSAELSIHGRGRGRAADGGRRGPRRRSASIATLGRADGTVPRPAQGTVLHLRRPGSLTPRRSRPARPAAGGSRRRSRSAPTMRRLVCLPCREPEDGRGRVGFARSRVTLGNRFVESPDSAPFEAEGAA